MLATTICLPALADFVPGRIYVPSDRAIFEYDTDLNLTRSIPMTGIHRGVTGAAFGPSGNIVYIANVLSPNGVTFDRTSVLEVNANGDVVREYDLAQFGFRQGQSVEYNSVTGYFAVSDAGRVIYLDQQLQFVSSSVQLTSQLIDGIAVMPDGRLVLSESAGTSTLQILNDDLSVAGSVFGGRAGLGGMVAFDESRVVTTSIRDTVIELVDIDSGEREILFDDIGRGSGDVIMLPSGDFVFTNGGGILTKVSGDGLDIVTSDPVFQTNGSLVYFVPSPASAAVLGIAVLWFRRRR